MKNIMKRVVVKEQVKKLHKRIIFDKRNCEKVYIILPIKVTNSELKIRLIINYFIEINNDIRKIEFLLTFITPLIIISIKEIGLILIDSCLHRNDALMNESLHACVKPGLYRINILIFLEFSNNYLT